MTSEVYVWAWTPGRTDPTAAGVLVPSGEDMHFAYAQSYLKRSDAVPLSPTLPLTDKWFRDAQDMNMPSALRDAAPDAWGRRVVLDRLTGVRGRDADVTALHESTYLLESGSNRFGAVDFQRSSDVYVPREDNATLDDLHRAAELLDTGEPLPDALARALVHGTSIGGARPKALIRDGDTEYIAKFSSSSDVFPVVGSEAASLYLAREAGVNVARAEVTRSLGKDVLLVERFDRGAGGTRRMAVSALTLLGLGEMTARYGTYPEIVRALADAGSDPDTAREMFRRIVFNVAISNTDDHLRNHAALWDGHHLELSPAYDLSPMSRTGDTASQALAYDEAGNIRTSSFASLVEHGGAYGLNRSEARDEVDRVRATITDKWDDAADFARLTRAQRDSLYGRQFLNPAASYGLPVSVGARRAVSSPASECGAPRKRGGGACRRRGRCPHH